MTAISKDIMRAAKHLVQRRWAQGDEAMVAPDRHGYCIASACVAACAAARIGGDQIHRDAVLLFKHANGIDRAMSVGDWNDAAERTKEDVLAAFDKAIEASSEWTKQATPKKKKIKLTPPVKPDLGGAA